MVKFYVDYADEPLKKFDENCKLSNALVRIKEHFDIDKSCRCYLKLGSNKLNAKKQIADQIKKGDTLTLIASKAVATKRPNDRPKLAFSVEHNNETKQFSEFGAVVVKNLVATAKEKFKIASKTECHLKLGGNGLKCDLSLAASGISNGSLLKLVFCVLEECEKIKVAGLVLTHTSLKPCFTLDSVSDCAKLYGIIDKLSKEECMMHQKPLSLYRYMGTVTFKSLEDRFKDHCTQKSSESMRNRFVFNSEQHCIVPIMEFSKEHLDPRFDTPNEAAVAFEILSTVWRKECNFVNHFRAGTGCREFNAKAVSKLTEEDEIILAETMINAVRNYE